MSRLAIVTATTNPARAQRCIDSWWRMRETDQDAESVHILLNGGEKPYLGTVPAFRFAVDAVLERHPEAEIIACLHDDFEILEQGWDQKVLRYFDRYPAMGLAGFGGATGLGAHDMYQKPYDPMSLARIGFRSDLVDAEQHGLRSLLAEPVACLDGFSMIGRRSFWNGEDHSGSHLSKRVRPWTQLEELGLIHHIYDGAVSALAARQGWQTWYIPLRGKHWGGQTAVGDQGYQAWAKAQVPEGDEGFWKRGHQLVYEHFRDILPLRV